MDIEETAENPENSAPDSVDAETAAGEAGPEPAPSPKKNADITVFGDEIEILTKKRLSHLDRGPSLAYAARSKGEAAETFFALICENQYVPRSAMAAKFSNIISPGLVRLIASGVVYWPPVDGQRYVFIYENTLGQPLMKNMSKGGLAWKQDMVMKQFIKPMVNILHDLRNADMVHGSINPMNIFDGGSEDKHDKIILGDCLAMPPSYMQPVLFEPVERAMADRLAKGVGTIEDDLYAFGVSITMILRSKDPMQGMSDDEIIRQKIELGSYAALTGKERFTGGILELLRGLLYDDRAQRWTLDEIEAWLDGQRLSPKQSSKKQKANRPIHFNNERYLRPGLLAMDLSDNPGEAVQMIDGGALEQWVSRSLEDNLTEGRLEQAVELAQEGGRGPGYWDRLLTRVSIALDPEAPIRFKGLKLHPEGFSYALAESFMLKRDLMPFVEIINQQLVMYWLTSQQELRVDVGHLMSKFDSCRAFLRQTTVGYGVERCLYFLCPECPCISERIEGYYVRNPEDLMYAYEEISGKPKRPELFIDRHVAAFLSVKDRRMIDPFLTELNAEEYHKRVLANLKVLATIQKRSRMGSFPGIAAWVADILDPVYERLHDRQLREMLRNKIAKLQPGGDLVKIITLLDNNEMRQRDFVNFKKAMDEYADLREEDAELKHKLEKPETFGRETGQEVAAVVSGLLAGVFILAFAFMHFTQTAFFN
ncbi:MAG: serine/threonine protein kinase [Rhodospirillales bacterium]|nr:serine/threonine protein kinase [Rhodospirillales bacterium]MCB9994979.1 serine/threonine protein kinase [Rhodospirillales bacterium]